MNPVLEGLEPRGVFEHFSNILTIPRPSLGEGPMVDYIKTWAGSNGFSYRIDQWNNISVHIPATPGCENWPKFILQAHSDMVTAVKPPASGQPDPEFTWPIEIEREGTVIHTKNHYQTLGADNGIGMAVAMDLAVSTEKHGEGWIVITRDEEDGFTGANNFSFTEHGITGRCFLINCDTPHDATVNSSCAGFKYVKTTLPITRRAPATGNYRYNITLNGMPGGHSGEDRHKVVDGNAMKRLVDLLRQMPEGWSLINLFGGEKSNSMPITASVVIETLSPAEEWRGPLDEGVAALATELQCAASLDITVSENDGKTAFGVEFQEKVLALIEELPDEVDHFDAIIKDLPALSTTLGKVESDGFELTFIQIVRGAHENEMQELADELKTIYGKYGCMIVDDDDHKAPSWYQDPNHPLVKMAMEGFRLEGSEPVLTGNHGALELGAFTSKEDSPIEAGVAIGWTVDNEHVHTESTNATSILRGYNVGRYMLMNINNIVA